MNLKRRNAIYQSGSLNTIVANISQREEIFVKEAYLVNVGHLKKCSHNRIIGLLKRESANH